jgi:hypothetical protein
VVLMRQLHPVRRAPAAARQRAVRGRPLAENPGAGRATSVPARFGAATGTKRTS